MRTKALLLMFTGLAALMASADHYVSPSGNNIDPYDSWYKAATDIQTAVDKAAPGSTVWIGSGEYAPVGAGRIITISKSLSLRGAADQETIIINGGGTRGGIYVNLASAAVLVEGLTITNCVVTGHGAGIRVASSGTSTVTVHNCVITGNNANYTTSSTGQGGGIYASGSGLYLEVSDCLIQGNKALNNDQRSGGGGFFTQARVLMRDCVISGNNGPRSGGGLSFDGVALNSEVRDCLIENNQTTGFRGGGVEV